MTEVVGAIRVNVEIATNKAKTGLSELGNALSRTANKVGGLIQKIRSADTGDAFESYSPALLKTQQEIDKTYRKIETLQKRMTAFEAPKPTDAYAALQDQLQAAEDELQRYVAEEQQLADSGFAFGTPWDRVIEKEAQASDKIDEIKTKMAELEGSGVAFTDMTGSEEYANMSAEMEGLQGHLQGLQDQAPGVGSALSAAFAAATTGAMKAASAIGRGLQAAFRKTTSALKTLGSAIKNKLSSAGKTVNSFGKKLLSLVGAVAIFSLISQAFQKMTNNIGEDLKYFAQSSTETFNSLRDIKIAMAGLEGAITSAFAPIANIAIPYLVQLINWLASAINMIGKFFAALSGKTTYKRLVTNNKKIADSLKDTGAAAEKASQNLAKFDELDVLNKDQGGGGGGGAEGAEDRFSGTVDEEIPENLKKLADLLKNGQYFDFGYELAEQLANALDSIPWGEIQAKAAKAAIKLASILNGVFSNLHFADSLGKTIAQGLNTGLAFAYTFLVNFDFRRFGIFIGTMINAAVRDFDWTILGATIGEVFNGLIDTAIGFLETTDWTALGTGVGTSIQSTFETIDWEGIGRALSGGVVALFDTLSGMIRAIDWGAIVQDIEKILKGLDWASMFRSLGRFIGNVLGGLLSFFLQIYKDILEKIGEYFSGYIEESGGNVVLGFLRGIVDALKNIAIWLYNNFFLPIWNGIKEAFKIHSPSKVMEDIGVNVIDGMKEGIANTWHKITDFFGESIEKIKTLVTDKFTAVKDKILGVMETIRTKWESIWNGIKNFLKGVINGIIGFINGLIRGVASGINKIIDVINTLEVHVPDWVPLFGGKQIGFNLAHVTPSTIPLLAEGAVIRGGDPFAAILGDQPAGQTNIETPLSTMVEAFRQALSEEGGIGSGINTVVLRIDSTDLGEVSLDPLIGAIQRRGMTADLVFGGA